MDGKSLDITQEKLNILKEILPDAFTEGKIDWEKLEVLKVLQKSYFGKIKMIYIDPPYNTGNDKFIYPDKFSETRDEYLSRIGDRDETGYSNKFDEKTNKIICEKELILVRT